MPASRTNTTTSSSHTASVGSIPINTDPPAPMRPTLPSASDKERALELEMERAQEWMRKLKERRRAKEEARKRAEEEAARRAAEEREREEAAAWAADARKKEEEAAERRKVAMAAAASHNCMGPSPSEVSTSTRRVEVEIPRVINKGRGKQRAEVTGRDPDDSNDGRDGDDNNDKEDEEKAPFMVKREGGLSGELLAVLESQMAQLLANNWSLRESASRTQQYLRQLLRQQDEDHARLVAIETRLAMADPATLAFSDEDEEDEEEEEVEKGEEGVEEEGEGRRQQPQRRERRRK
ncbi:hypothetical protein EV368DRAFT_80764 [Lentinula lateritia]|nr:hypothetical protein EV368DRAFT_80764 [Lentinula lateritia]